MTDFIPWNEALLTGIDSVDEQHHGLVDLINEMAPNLAHVGESRLPEIEPVYVRLMEYARIHFRSEEKIMLQSGVDSRAFEHHVKTHADFVAQVESMVSDFMNDRGVTGLQLLHFLASWLVFHILGEDKSMARQISVIQAGESPLRAYQLADGENLAPHNEDISQTMVSCFAQMSEQNNELSQLRDHLEEEVRERTRHLEHLTEELRQARDVAEAADHAKGRFLGVVSHELRTPMNSIIGFSQLLKKEGLAPHQDALTLKINTSANHLLELIDRILEFSRDEAALSEPLNLASLLEAACKKPFALARKKGLSTQLMIDPELPSSLLGDVYRLELIVNLLVMNAAKFTEHGSVQVRVRRINEESQRFQLRFEVEDSGIGIPESEQEGLFGLFQQIDDSATRKQGGVGLGLALARQVAGMLDARLGLQSEQGKGSLFWCELWLEADPQNNAQQALQEDVKEAQETEPGEKGEPCHAKALVAQLEQLLRESDTRAGELFEQSVPCLRSALGHYFEPLAGQIADFEFDRALETLIEYNLTQTGLPNDPSQEG